MKTHLPELLPNPPHLLILGPHKASPPWVGNLAVGTVQGNHYKELFDQNVRNLYQKLLGADLGQIPG